MKQKYDGTFFVFVDLTENGEMEQEVQRICKENKVKLKVVEMMRHMVKNELQRSNPFKVKGRDRTDCQRTVANRHRN